MRSNRIGFNASEPEIAAAVEAVRRAKAEAGGRDLTLAELDAVMPAVECRRTRIRERRLAAGLRDVPNASPREVNRAR